MKESTTDRITFVAMVCIVSAGIMEVLGYLVLGTMEATVTFLIIEAIFALVAVAAWKGRMPWLHLLTAGFAFVLAYTTNYAETTSYNWGFWMQMAAAAAAVILGCTCMLRKKEKYRSIPWQELILAICISACALAV